ncbi:MAG: heavy metal translocating P-type ATPase, partial [Oscillospiraceae bacterium]|nr:heavy metal translocating P-type ATPase [Oscillospiraceae bacterium]
MLIYKSKGGQFMEQKVYEIENLCCANCAAKIEAKINELPEVEQAVIVFPTKQLRLTAEHPDGLIEKITAIAQTVEPDVTFHADHHHHEHHEGCSCGHDHHHEHEHEHGGDSRDMLMGGLLFIFGLVLDLLGYGIISKAAFACAYLVLGREVLASAVKNLIKGRMLDENFLMSIATLGAFCINEFPEAVGVMLFYRIGEFFEEKAVARSRSQIMEAVDLRPEVVHLVSGMTVKAIPAADAKPGDRVMVRPGDRIPLDGVVIAGDSRIDTAPITGEPVPVHVTAGSEVISGCVNTSGQLIVEVRKPLSESMVTRILHSVENAAASKPRIDRFITRFARIYTPVVVGLALAVAIVPSLITGNWGYWVYTALSFLVM